MQDKKTIFCLALLRRVSNVREDQLVKLLTDSLYLDFFEAKQIIHQLLDRKLIMLAENKQEQELDSNGRKVLRYNLKPEGAAVADLLYPELPQNMQNYLEILSQGQRRSKLSSKQASIQEIDGSKVRLILTADEGQETIFRLELLLPSLDLAEQIKADWTKDPAALYQNVLMAVYNQS